MRQSLFAKYVAALMASLVTLIEKVNGKREATLTYYHKNTSILKKVFSADGKWESTSVNTTYVAADFVSMDSPLPIKSRDSIATANGKLPKLGISKTLKESDIDALNTMEAQPGDAGVRARRIRKKLADDPVACNVGLDELLEYSFLFGLSHGYVAMPDEDHPNAMLRLNFGYFEKNTFGATKKGQISLEDIKRVISAADEANDTIIKIWISKTDFDALRQTREAKELCANYRGQTYTKDTELPVPTAKLFQEAFEDDTNVTFEIVNRSIQFEKNGRKKSVKPWAEHRLIFVCNEQIGSLVYGTLAEATNKVEGVLYQLIDDFKLISKYSLTNPLREMTGGQAKAACIIEDVDQIYIYDFNEGTSEEVNATEEAKDSADTKITVWGKTYTKSEVIASLKAITGDRIASNIGDEKLIEKINELSDEQEAQLKESLTPIA